MKLQQSLVIWLAFGSLNSAQADEPMQARGEPNVAATNDLFQGRVSPLAAALNDMTSPLVIRLQDSSAPANGGGEEEGGIKDNSFLIEEAYNQEAGIVQHIFNWVPGWSWEGGRSRTFDFVFTQEWPIHSMTHQFSYSIPCNKFSDHPDGEPSSKANGIGDIMLNYRYQLLEETECQPAVAPRFSLILPSGDEDDGLGSGELGYQFNLPISKEIDDWAFHFNAGFTVTPGVKAGVDPIINFDGRTLNGYNLGGSAIWLARKDLNFMFEALAVWGEELTDKGSEDHTLEIQLSPGVRWAPYTSGSTQWVLGLGLPIGVSQDAPDISLFFYMSFEHPFKEVSND